MSPKLLLTLISFFQLGISQAGTKVVYGDDDRFEPYERPQYFTQSQSVAAMINKSNLGFESLDGFNISARTHQQAYGLCSGSKFIDQPILAHCSGSLVAEDVILTAGHCVESDFDCTNFDWVFGYEMNQKTGNPKKFEKKNIYHCKDVIAQSSLNGFDYALIKLDRKVMDRNPLKMATPQYRSQVGEPLLMLGFPSGLPLKITESASVLKLEDHLLVTNLDAFHVNSGSPVLNQKTGKIIGILVSGRPDYIQDPKQNCSIVNTLDNSMGGERVTSLFVVPRDF